MTLTTKQVNLIHQRRREGVSYRVIAREIGLKNPNSVFWNENRYPLGIDMDVIKANRLISHKSPYNHCYICGKRKPNTEFCKDGTRGSGIASKCKACYKPHSSVYMAIKKGTLKRTNCVVCGSNKNIEGHHKDYTKPLEVVWLCRPHHFLADKKIIKV